jgi:hypothetical protein
MAAINLGDFGTVTATGTPNPSCTLNANDGIVTTPALTTAAGATFTLTVTNANATPNSIVQVEVMGGGTNTNLGTYVNEVTPAAGSFTVNLKNGNAGALNGSVKIGFSLT